MIKTNEVKLIDYLKEYNDIEEDLALENKLAIRALMNITNPDDLDEDYYEMQDAYLNSLLEESYLDNASDLPMIEDKIALWNGDITLIKADVLVNSAASNLEGSYEPLHMSNDNAIHSFAGLQLRRDCKKLVFEQGFDEEVGKCKVTKGYNLPCKYIFHTVTPRISSEVTKEDEDNLKKCYLSCLRRMEIVECKTIVFPLLASLEYNFPIDLEIKIAVDTVRKYLSENETLIEKVVFCTGSYFEDEEFEKYITKPQLKLVKKFSK